MKDYARSFYKGRAWKDTQAAYMVSQCYVCERCGRAARVVHHKTYINPQNIHDPAITLDWNNLEALCMDCHAQEHLGKSACANGLAFNKNGDLVRTMNCIILCGAPGSGKTTFANTNKRAGDLIVDLDYIGAALVGDLTNIYSDHNAILPVAFEVRDTIYRCIAERKGYWHTAYVVTSKSNRNEINGLAHQLSADIHIMDTDINECKRRIQQDNRRENKELFLRLIDDWFVAFER